MDWRPPVRRALEEGQRLGAVGPAPAEEAIERAATLAPLLPAGVSTAMDLGTGVGLPGLVLAALRPEITWTLVDAANRRIQVVIRAVEELGWGDRVRVVHGRAAELGSRDEWRGSQDVVVARSFGAPATTAEEARPFLHLGSVLLVTEPPDVRVEDRWPRDGLARLGLERGESVSSPRVQYLRVAAESSETVPRRDGVARKRPLW